MISVLPVLKEHLPLIEQGEKEIFSDAWSKESLDEQLSLPYDKSLVAFFDGIFCGYLIATLIAGEGEILRIATLPAYRKQGVGKKLLCHFSEQGENIFLEVRSKNIPARSLYESLGFAVMGTRKNYYKDPYDDAVLYHYQNKGQAL
ncbi:MAG: ribosomal protein S18-alanine N-acetyltransferase [Clostridia bacterium]|nr:ribosomal protein S18-alanine N-acetyltransferase [Clostridia bacterium]